MELFLALGAVGGVLHGALLWWSVRRGPLWAASFGIVRLAALGALLIGAAVGHGLFPAALGWGAGFAGMCLAYLSRAKPGRVG